jgi:hypothetical protein
MTEVNNISFKLNSSYDGIGSYFLYNGPGCDDPDLILTGSVNIINGSSIININQTLLLNNTISLKFIDNKGCIICEDYEIDIFIPECTPFTGTAQYVEEPPEFNTYYLAAPRSIQDLDNSDGNGCVDIFDYCTDPGYNMNQIVYANTTDTSVEQLLNTTIYSDILLTIPFVGLGSDYRYAVSNTSGLNTFVVGPTGYKLITIEDTGFVSNVEINPCQCEDNGGGPIV